jgi:hypothetical protein
MADENAAEERRTELDRFLEARALILDVDRVTRQIRSITERATVFGEYQTARHKARLDDAAQERVFPTLPIYDHWVSAVQELQEACGHLPT